MSLLSDLKTAKTEEDVKDAYVKALGLKQFSKNLVDIQTKEIWFEAKEAGTSPVAMFISVTVHLIIAVFGSNITDAIIKCTVTEIRLSPKYANCKLTPPTALGSARSILLPGLRLRCELLRWRRRGWI